MAYKYMITIYLQLHAVAKAKEAATGVNAVAMQYVV
jgi:hypothetical protein